MTPQEFEYIQRAMKALEDPAMTQMAQVKVLRTVSQICGKCATEIEQKLVDSVDSHIERRYQDLQNQRMIDILSK